MANYLFECNRCGNRIIAEEAPQDAECCSQPEYYNLDRLDALDDIGKELARLDRYKSRAAVEDIEHGSVWYGTLSSDAAGPLYEIPYVTHSDYSGDLVHMSNYKVIQENYAPEQTLWLVHSHGGHGTAALFVFAPALEGAPLEDLYYLTELLADLRRYPLVCEDHYSQLEWDTLEESMEDIVWDLRRELDRQIDTDMAERVVRDAIEVQAVWPVFENTYSAWIRPEDLVEFYRANEDKYALPSIDELE